MHKVQLISPIISNKVYQTNSISKGAKKCYKELKESGNISVAPYFIVKDLSVGETYKYNINKKYQKGGENKNVDKNNDNNNDNNNNDNDNNDNDNNDINNNNDNGSNNNNGSGSENNSKDNNNIDENKITELENIIKNLEKKVENLENKINTNNNYQKNETHSIYDLPEPSFDTTRDVYNVNLERLRNANNIENESLNNNCTIL